MKAGDRQEFFTRLRSVTPEPATELNYDSPFELLIAVILSAQATDVGVNKATKKLSLIHISEPTRLKTRSRMPSSA